MKKENSRSSVSSHSILDSSQASWLGTKHLESKHLLHKLARFHYSLDGNPTGGFAVFLRGQRPAACFFMCRGLTANRFIHSCL